MHCHRSTLLLAIAASALLVACGGGGSSLEPPPPGITEADRVAAATTTANTNAKCSESTLGTYYWEIGDKDGAKVSGSRGAGAPTAATNMWVYSASKWLYAANVVQKRGVLDADVPFLNFTSGYTNFGNAPICFPADTTVQGCLLGRDGQDATTVGKYYYDSGHMQHHAATVMGLGPADTTALAVDLTATIGELGFSYKVPQLASGVIVAPKGYAEFLRRMLRGELAIASALGTHKVCADPKAIGCNAVSAPELGADESWNYSLGHWVEDDPSLGDHAFSSAGGGGFYPWIDRSKTYYGLVARERNFESDAGYHSAECGRLIRQAWITGTPVSKTSPTP